GDPPQIVRRLRPGDGLPRLGRQVPLHRLELLDKFLPLGAEPTLLGQCLIPGDQLLDLLVRGPVFLLRNPGPQEQRQACQARKTPADHDAPPLSGTQIDRSRTRSSRYGRVSLTPARTFQSYPFLPLRG